MKEWKGAYVAHECKECGKIFVAEDYTKAKAFPPKWRYCPQCAEIKGINYEKQTPKKNRSPEKQKIIDARIEILKSIGAEKLKEYHRNKKLKNII